MLINMKMLKWGISLWLIVSLVRCDIQDNDTIGTSGPDQEEEDFKRFEDRLVGYMKSARKQAFPFLTRAVYDVKLSQNCSRSLMKLYNDLVSLKTWALKMLDSSGKTPSGLLKGSMTLFGDFDECLEILEPSTSTRKGPDILGKYCLTFLYFPSTLLVHLRQFNAGKIRNTSSTERFKEIFDLMSRYKFDGTAMHTRYGICLPSTCTAADLESILLHGLKDSGIKAEIRRCEVRGKFHYTEDQLTILCIFGLVLTVVFVGTLWDFVVSMTENSDGKQPCIEQSISMKILLHFSMKCNLEKLLSDDLEEEKYLNISCLRGVAVLTFCFYMVVNSYAIIDEQAIRNYSSSIHYFTILKEPFFAIIANSMLYVDALFTIAGFVIFYTSLNNHNGNGICVKSVAVKTICRCVLPVLGAIGVFLLLPLFGDGPAFHEVLDRPLNACRKNWWTNILFCSNFLQFEDQCLLHTWFLGCLVQLIIIGFIFKGAIKRWPKLGIISLIILTVVCNVYLGVTSVQDRLPPAMSMYFIFSVKTVKKVTETIFFLPHAHFGAFAVGMLTGYWVRNQPDLRIKKVWKLTILMVMVVLFCCLVFGLYPYHDGSEMKDFPRGLYSSLHGIIFGVVVSLSLVLSLKAESDIITRTLSSKYFLPFRKLVFYAYLLHWSLIFFRVAITREKHYLSHYEQIFRSFGNIMATYILAFIFHIFFHGLFTLDEVLAPPTGREEASKNGCINDVLETKTVNTETNSAFTEDLVMQQRNHIPD